MENGEIQQLWEDLLRNPDKSLAFREHMMPLVTTDECEFLLADIADRVRGAHIAPADGARPARLVFTLEDPEGEVIALTCWPPAAAVPSALPASLACALRLHNGMCFPDDEGWAVHLNSVDTAGALGTGFEPGTAVGDEAIEDPSALVVPIDSYSDWFVFHPSARTDDGEPAVALLSHEGGGLEVPLSTEFGAPGTFLRLLGHAVLGGGDARCEDYVT